MRHSWRWRVALVAGAAVTGSMFVVPGVRAATADPSARAQLLARRALTTAADHATAVQILRQQGYLVGDRARFDSLKANPAAPGEKPAAAGSTSPVTGPSWQGVDEDDLAPPDTTGAIGPHSYIEAINLQVAIYDRKGGLISKAPFESLTTGSPMVSHLDLSDPQMIWDGHTQRFYFVALDVNTDTFYWGFSKTANPTQVGATGSAADWCSYNADFGYGSNLPDYPKLGQSRDYLMIGANVYSGEAYVGSDIDTISKPGPGAIGACPSPNTFRLEQDAAILDCGANPSPFAADPNPAVEAGWSDKGWVVAIPDATNSGTVGSNLDVITVTKGSDGSAQFSDPTCVDLPDTYTPPPPAPQPGTPFFLDTLDGRLTHAVAAIDPSRGSTTWAIWTSHTIAGGAGSLVRWYEIDPVRSTLLQTGDVSDANLYVFDGGISDDRAATGATSGKYGSNMVVGVTTTSSSSNPAIQMVSKVGNNAQSPLVLVKQSPGPDQGFDCSQNPIYPTKCRWGDYSGATPDPTPPNGSVGRVWLTNEWVSGDFDLAGATWRTWNWAATP